MDKEFKKLLCKNDDCLRLLAEVCKVDYKPGVVFRVKCHSCGLINEWRFGYTKLEEQFATLKEVVEEGG